MRLLLRALPLLLLSLAVHAAGSDRRIAVTIDDLPWARLDQIAPADLQARHDALMAQLRQAAVPVIGFVNENKLEVDGQVQPARVQMLRDWLDAGYVLGNHTWSHMDLNVAWRRSSRISCAARRCCGRCWPNVARCRRGCGIPTCALDAPQRSARRWMRSSGGTATAWRR